ncbi:hypothetical protein [Pseudolysinimonas yzui]|uniref:Uncharacterized protein n=1 Tax=Pseudolysinimonas yzui TaxID=2708254 RepID=A0A8J3GTH7_9MICO|nr:hypothetical protein [Pseudolysinimonas yzui]GHF26868.1 hypothetical protein GCM10011600_29740 [Pseudolysinimonas yzui]
MADDARIDPRYAAQFQRGFDPARDASPVRRGPMRLEGGPPATAPRVPDPPRKAPAQPVEVPEDAEELTPAVAPTRVASTWWDWLLPGIGAVFIMIALMLLWSMATDTGAFYGSGVTSEWEVFLEQARWMLPSPLLTAGVVAITGGIVLQAVRPRE